MLIYEETYKGTKLKVVLNAGGSIIQTLDDVSWSGSTGCWGFSQVEDRLGVQCRAVTSCIKEMRAKVDSARDYYYSTMEEMYTEPADSPGYIEHAETYNGEDIVVRRLPDGDTIEAKAFNMAWRVKGTIASSATSKAMVAKVLKMAREYVLSKT